MDQLIHERNDLPYQDLSSGVKVAPTVSLEPRKFKLRRALIITKLSRYEFEQSRYPELNEEQFHQMMRKRGTDLDAWIYHHKLHKSFEDNIVKCFRDAGCEVKMTSRAEFRSSLSKEVMNWADVIVPIGGDGTFLLAAGRASPLFAQSHTKIPIVGFNSDPQRSAGRLLLPKHYSDCPKEAVAKIKAGDFKWMHRTRIRSTILGNNGKMPQSYDLYRHCISKMEQETTRPETLDMELNKKYNAKVKRVLPYLALNEVFIGETLSSRVTHLQSPSVIDFTATDDIPANATGKRKNSSQYNPAKRRAEAAKLDKLYKKREQQENQKYRERKLQLQQQSLECQQQTLQCLQQLLRTMKERDEKTESFHDCVLETIGTAVFQPHLQKHNDTSDEDKVPLQ
uniref:Uncharacterized protein n=1 Tax=Glossina brevipalpis TaxID=37001 RepID=A0A1A9WBB3_9MUSC